MARLRPRQYASGSTPRSNFALTASKVESSRPCDEVVSQNGSSSSSRVKRPSRSSLVTLERCACLSSRLALQGVVINDLLTQITAVFVTIRGASNGSGTKTTGSCRILADPRHGPGDAGGARAAGATRLGL